MRAIKDKEGRSIFAFHKRGNRLNVYIDPKLWDALDEELANKAMEICPVGSIIVKEKGFEVPIGARKYDNEPIGSEIEKQ